MQKRKKQIFFSRLNNKKETKARIIIKGHQKKLFQQEIPHLLNNNNLTMSIVKG